MRRLRGLDLALFGTLVSLWVICFSLGVKSTLLPVQLSPVFATVPAAGAYPRVLRFRTYVDPPAYSIRPGDTLLSLDGADLRGVGTGMFSLRWMAGGDFRVSQVQSKMATSTAMAQAASCPVIQSVALATLARTHAETGRGPLRETRDSSRLMRRGLAGGR
jgi:hypothetical protein